MAFEITAFYVRRIRAAASHGNLNSWVNIDVVEEGKDASTVTLFFIGDDAQTKADAYAAAINFVDLRFHTAEALEDVA